MAGADNNTRTSRLKAIGIFAGITLLLVGLSAGGLYFARQRSSQLASTNQDQVAQQDANGGQADQDQNQEQEQEQAQGGNQNGQQNQSGATGNTPGPQPDSGGQGNPPAPQQPVPQPQPQPQAEPQPQDQSQVPATGPTPQVVPATGPMEDLAVLARIGMLGVMAYAAMRWLASRKVRI